MKHNRRIQKHTYTLRKKESKLRKIEEAEHETKHETENKEQAATHSRNIQEHK